MTNISRFLMSPDSTFDYQFDSWSDVISNAHVFLCILNPQPTFNLGVVKKLINNN